jgi:hypothetical protein
MTGILIILGVMLILQQGWLDDLGPRVFITKEEELERILNGIISDS